MKTIQLTQGHVAKVSDDWYEELNKFKWYAHYAPHTNSYYATRHIYILGKQITILMHRVIANTPNDMKTDHIDHDTLNNQSDNLRNCTGAQNRHNSKKDIDSTSGYKGVTPHGKNWNARIMVEAKPIHIGTYPTPEEAARAYDQAAKKYFGEFANPNFHN